jgi:hypothetical protein
MPSEAGTIAAHDSFIDVLRSDIVAGTERLSAWINHVHAAGGINTLFELECWLRGLRTFFDLRHLPLAESERANPLARSFAPEIRIAKNVLGICERRTIDVIRLGQASKVEFETFLENQMQKGGALDYHVAKILEQPTLSDSLHRLLESISDIGVIIDSLRDPPQQDLRVFLSLGRTYDRALRGCRYVDMLLAQRFRLQYDRLDSAILSAALRMIAEAGTRRSVALALLYLYRFMRYLNLVARDLAGDCPLRHTLVLFSLLHREMGAFADFMKARFVKARRVGSSLRNAGELITHSLRVDTQRTLQRELVYVSGDGDAAAIYTKIENSHGILSNCLQSCVVTLVQAVDPGVEGQMLFPAMVEGLQKAQKLRQDLWSLRQDLKDLLERNVEFNLSRPMGLIAAFRESSLRFLMYRDWEEFERFSDALITSANAADARAHLRSFLTYLDLLVTEVSKRSVFQVAGQRERPAP